MIKSWPLSRPAEPQQQQRPPIAPPPCAPRVSMKARNLRNLCLVLSILLYLLIGAAVFDALESDGESAKTEALEEKLGELKRKYGFSEGDYREVERVVLQAAPHRAGRQWKFAGSFYFAITVVTTIGKCHFSICQKALFCFDFNNLMRLCAIFIFTFGDLVTQRLFDVSGFHAVLDL